MLRNKKRGGNTSWFTEVTYLGNIDEVPYDDARQAFAKHLGTLGEEAKDRKRAVLSAGELMDLYLDWVQKNRSVSNYTGS
jgi:hypothetical protein